MFWENAFLVLYWNFLCEPVYSYLYLFILLRSTYYKVPYAYSNKG